MKIASGHIHQTGGISTFGPWFAEIRPARRGFAVSTANAGRQYPDLAGAGGLFCSDRQRHHQYRAASTHDLNIHATFANPASLPVTRGGADDIVEPIEPVFQRICWLIVPGPQPGKLLEDRSCWALASRRRLYCSYPRSAICRKRWCPADPYHVVHTDGWLRLAREII